MAVPTGRWLPLRRVAAGGTAGERASPAGTDSGDTRNVVLTLARVWATLATGEIKPKDAAADWALAHLPAEHRPVLAHARDLYRTRHYAEETWSPDLVPRVRPLVDEVLARIGELRG